MKKMIYTTKATMLFFVGMTLSLFCSAQEYESFFGEQNTTFTQFFTYEWFNYIPDGGGSDIIGNGFTFNSYCSKEDTAWINDKLYYKTSYVPQSDEAPDYYPYFFMRLIEAPAEFGFFLREDRTEGKLYLYCAATGTEALFCDMSLKEQDTFYFPFGDNFENNPFQYFGGNDILNDCTCTVVDSIGYINNKKVIYLQHIMARYGGSSGNDEQNLRLRFVEGVGPTYGPAIEINRDNLISHYTVLLCTYKDNALDFVNNETFGCSQTGYIPIGINSYNKQQMHIFQDGVSNLIVELPECEICENGDILIIDISGHVLYNKKLSANPCKIDISHFDQGVYIVNFVNGKYSCSDKFIKYR
ncbi:MAG: T9SS type A sorting domain-containing protein [Bacteroidales bacterium]|nr:T9SS type A sorting domain-containing protein [Bacteroidales bacterium]MDD3153165.1 T9SS type A sorting domain-containing protein [Bacteroidales bacterium]MDD3914215.1 T9SS type A sorting domain-containing protein [Bacteroidales bacterium]MDD4634808.1 T9SS type A sorting domain-containing protein [Bacteroidales bacterium]